MTVIPIKSRRWWTDPTLIGLIIANALTIWFVVPEQPSLLNALWIYWGQSVVIGLFTIARVVTYGTAPAVMVQSIRQSGASAKATTINRIAKWMYAPFFLLHYGGFHLGYAIFLGIFSADINNVSGFGGQAINLGVITPAIIAFALAHSYSFFIHRNQELRQATSVDVLTGRAYQRIIPMHLTIVLGGLILSFFSAGSTTVLLLFLCLKAASDIGAHIVEHREEALIETHDQCGHRSQTRLGA